VENISFGVFAEAVLMLNTADIDGMAVGRKYKEKLCTLNSGKSLSVNFGYIWAYKGYLMGGYEIIGIFYYL
jgi:hypothetical protein